MRNVRRFSALLVRKQIHDSQIQLQGKLQRDFIERFAKISRPARIMGKALWMFAILTPVAVSAEAQTCQAKGNLGPISGMNVTIQTTMGNCYLNSHVSDYFNFSGNAGQTVTFRLNSAWSDSVLGIALNLNSALLGFRIGFGTQVDWTVTLSSTSNYVLIVEPNAITTGAYTLRAVEGASIPTPTPQPTATSAPTTPTIVPRMRVNPVQRTPRR